VGNLLQSIFGPIGTIFNAIFYEPIYNILMLIYNLIHATGIYGGFGLSIIALTLLVRCAMIPLTRKQLKSSRAMQELAPQINALKVQYRGDPQGLMKAQQDLYKEHGYSPVSGCLPLLIQMPFLYALLFSFRNLLTENLTKINDPIYPFLPHLTALPNPSFLWTNLSQSDPLHILPFLAAFFTLVQLRMAMPVRKKPAPGVPSDPTTQATQTTMYIMPVITFIFALSFPSGLALYWTVGAMFASVQQYFLAGWGSLFLGIPGLEHLVPPPKELPGTAPAIGGPRVAGAGARSLVASSPSSSTSSPPPERSGGLRGFFRQMRDMAEQQTQSQEAARAARGSTSGDRNVVDAVPSSDRQVDNVNGAKKVDAGMSGTGNGASQVSRRNRAADKTPRLVKPPATSADLPEKAIQREAAAAPLDDAATNSETGSNPLPEVAISRAAKSNGRGTSGSPSSSSSTTASRPALSARNTGSTTGNGNIGSGSRRSNGSNGKGSTSSNRNRSTNRSKGGR
jgi:YidC/Oxa1 family membrane protein insertase